jgi:hypothetical protein
LSVDALLRTRIDGTHQIEVWWFKTDGPMWISREWHDGDRYQVIVTDGSGTRIAALDSTVNYPARGPTDACGLPCPSITPRLGDPP